MPKTSMIFSKIGLTSWLSFVVSNWVCHFPIGILGQVWYMIVSIPDLCTRTYFDTIDFQKKPKIKKRAMDLGSNRFIQISI